MIVSSFSCVAGLCYVWIISVDMEGAYEGGEVVHQVYN